MPVAKGSIITEGGGRTTLSRVIEIG